MGVVALGLALVQLPSLNILSFGAKPDDNIDDTRPLRKALEQAKRMGGARITFPKGTFIIQTATVYSNTELVGSGPETILARDGYESRRFIVCGPIGDHYSWKRNPVRNVRFADMTLRDWSDRLPMAEHHDLLTFNGVENGRVERVRFIGFRGDGLYIGGGDIRNEIVRHNLDITVRDCVFDGLNRRNRNGLTVIDGVRVLIENNTFTNCTSDVSPAAIDIEPNKNPYHHLQDITVRGNTFRNNGGTAIMVDVAIPQYEKDLPVKRITIENNKIDGQQRRGILINQLSNMDPVPEPIDALIRNNEIRRSPAPIAIEGVRGVNVLGNRIYDCREGMMIGYGSFGRGAQDLLISSNKVYRTGAAPSKHEGSAVVLHNVRGIRVEKNELFDMVTSTGQAGAVVTFRASSGGGAGKNVRIVGNRSSFPTKTPVGKSVAYRVREGYVLDLPTLTVAENVLGP
jgi:hypothetical protein